MEKHDGTKTENDQETANELNQAFQNVFVKENNCLPILILYTDEKKGLNVFRYRWRKKLFKKIKKQHPLTRWSILLFQESARNIEYILCTIYTKKSL